MPDVTYGYWRMDKDQEPGYTRELISCDAERILDQTNINELDALIEPELDTVYKLMQRAIKLYPNS